MRVNALVSVEDMGVGDKTLFSAHRLPIHGYALILQLECVCTSKVPPFIHENIILPQVHIFSKHESQVFETSSTSQTMQLTSP